MAPAVIYSGSPNRRERCRGWRGSIRVNRIMEILTTFVYFTQGTSARSKARSHSSSKRRQFMRYSRGYGREAIGAIVRRASLVIVLALAPAILAGCNLVKTSSQEVVAAGDIAKCSADGDEATAELLEGIDGTVLALGDNAYPRGTAANFEECYEPSWGRFKGRTKPVPGNHEYYTQGARGYFEYFGEAAGEPEEGYYSYEVGSWHVVALNSNCGEAQIRCSPSSTQVRWLEEDLAANADDEGECTLAYMHHPRFSSGEEHGSYETVEPMWEALYEAGAELVLSGHEHNYERFAPQDPSGKADPEGGIRQFVG